MLRQLSERRGWPLMLLVPSLVLVAAVVLYPTLWGMALSVREMRLTRPDLGTGFVGLRHYVTMLSDPVFRLALVNTFIWVAAAVLLELMLGMVAALALDRGLRGTRWMGVAILLPWFLPSVVVGNMWALMLDSRLGVINDLLVRVGLLAQYKAWFADPATALGAAILVEVWRSYPFFALLLLAGLKGIPDELYDAAKVDGAGPARRFRHVTLPMLRVVLAAAIVLRVIGLVNAPDMILILTNGGPAYSTEVLSLYAFTKAYQEFDFGYASALAVVLFLLVGVFAAIYVRLVRATESEA